MDVVILLIFTFAYPAAPLGEDTNQPRRDLHIRLVGVGPDGGEGINPFLCRAAGVKLALLRFRGATDLGFLLGRTDARKEPRLMVGAAWGGASGEHALLDNIRRYGSIREGPNGSTGLHLLMKCDRAGLHAWWQQTGIKMIRSVKKLITDQVEHLRLPTQAKLIAQTDRRGLPSQAIDAEAAIHLAYNWLCQAQDATADGGVSRDYSLVSGWATSYPETTGYIIPTFLELSGRNNLPEAGIRARKMLDWLVSIQFADGGFQGGKADASP